MRYKFLLDESVLMKLLNAIDTSSMELWTKILINCHRVIFSYQLYSKFLTRVKNWRKKKLFKFPVPGFEMRIMELLTRSDKQCWINEEEVEEEKYIRHEADKYFARIIAQSKGCIFVSTDKKTRDDINRPEISNKYDVKALTIEDALALASMIP